MIKLKTHKRWRLFLLVTLFSVWFSGYIQREVQTFSAKPTADFYDFHVYYIAGQVARSDTDKRLYSYKEIQDPDNPANKIIVNPQLQAYEADTTYGQFAKQVDADVGQYLYAPFFSLAVVPLTYLPYEYARILWHFFIFLLLCGAVCLIVKLFCEDYLTTALVSGIIILITEFTLPMRDLQLVGNIGSLILFLTVAGLYLHKKHPALGALFFALAVIIKLTPIVVVPLMIMRRQWRWLITFCCWSILLWGIGIGYLGWQNHYEFFTRVMPAMSGGVLNQNNRSISTALQAAAAGKFLSFDEIRESGNQFPAKTPVLIFKILGIVSFGGLLFFCWYINKTDSRVIVEILLITLWSIIFSPVSFRHYYIISLAPIIYVWLHPLTKKASTPWLLTLSFATFVIFSVLPIYASAATNFFPIQLFLFMLMPIGVILFMAYLMTMLKSSAVIPAELIE